jgi:type IV pilus assembly protein PilE
MLLGCTQSKNHTSAHPLARVSSWVGFTLIELMFVVAIVAILLALAYPSYLEQVRKARRADATSSLMDRAQVLERCFTRLNTYVGCPTPEGLSNDGYYNIEFGEDEPTATTYSLVAEPAGDQVNDVCGEFTVDFLGNKTPVPDGNRCWGSS